MKILRFIKNYWKRKEFYERRETEKNYKNRLDYILFQTKNTNFRNFNIFGYNVAFHSKKEIEKGFSVSSVSTSIVLFVLFVLLNGLFIFYYKNKFPNIEFYDDYFVFKKEKVYYENLKYFFFKDNRVFQMKKFSKILYKPDGGNWKKIDGSGYDYDLFSVFQKYFLEKKFSKAVENIENGGVEIFPFQNQGFVKNKFLFSSEEGLQELTQIFESSPKIQVSNKSVTFDNEIYDWENYNIEFEIGTITVSDLKKNTILEIEAKNTVICQEILLKNLIENFDKKYPKFY